MSVLLGILEACCQVYVFTQVCDKFMNAVGECLGSTMPTVTEVNRSRPLPVPV